MALEAEMEELVVALAESHACEEEGRHVSSARSARLAEKMDEDGEASEEIASRPPPHTPKGTESFALNGAVEIACHRQCRVLWQAYARCKEDREEAKDPHKECNGWYETYIHCVDNQGPKLVLKAYQALTQACGALGLGAPLGQPTRAPPTWVRRAWTA